MSKKILMLIILSLFCFNMKAEASSWEYRYHIIGDSQNRVNLKQKKNDLLVSFKELVDGLDEQYYEQAILDQLDHSPYPMSYRNHTIYLTLGDGDGKEISGELITDLCSSQEQEIETHFFFLDLFS